MKTQAAIARPWNDKKCPKCGLVMHYLGYARHRAMHYREWKERTCYFCEKKNADCVCKKD